VQPADVKKRYSSRDFEPGSRFYAVDDGRIVGYCGFHVGGRVSYPWCMRGHEHRAPELFHAAVNAVKARGAKYAFAAYRKDWQPQADFFTAHDFPVVREWVNFIQGLTEMPTLAARPSSPISEFRPSDVPALHAMAPELFRGVGVAELREHLLNNPYLPPESLFVMRSRSDGYPLAIGLVVENPAYGDPAEGDPKAPCFRLGAFGTEGLTHKRVNGLFSLVVPKARSTTHLALDLMGHAAVRLDATTADAVCAQVPTDAPHLLHFYQSYFQRQGSFPVYERAL
jgi:hypothetical protein